MSWTSRHPPFCFIHEGRPKAGAELAMTRNCCLIILPQPLDIGEFDLRALRIGEAAAKLFENPAHPLHIDFAGNLHRQIVTEFAPVPRPSARIVAIASPLVPADVSARARA